MGYGLRGLRRLYGDPGVIPACGPGEYIVEVTSHMSDVALTTRNARALSYQFDVTSLCPQRQRGAVTCGLEALEQPSTCCGSRALAPSRPADEAAPARSGLGLGARRSPRAGRESPRPARSTTCGIVLVQAPERERSSKSGSVRARHLYYN